MTRYSVIVFLPFGIPYAIFMTGIIGISLLLEQSRRDATAAIWKGSAYAACPLVRSIWFKSIRSPWTAVFRV